MTIRVTSPTQGCATTQEQTLEDFEVRGRVISGRAIFVANADGDAPFADSFSDIMHDLSRLIRFQFAASQTGTYFFGVRILKGERVPTGSYEVAVTTPAPDIINQGDGPSDSIALRYYSSGSGELDMDPVRGLDAGENREFSATLTPPLSAGEYHYWACVHSVPRESDTQNNCSEDVTLLLR